MSTTNQFDRRTMTVEEAAAVLGIGRGLAYEAVRRGKIPAVRIGRRLLVLQAALDRLLAGSALGDGGDCQTPPDRPRR